MTQEPSTVEQAVARALRDNLGTLQNTARELEQAVADLVSACASSRPTNALPPLVRAQTSAASLAAALEVLSRFVATSLAPRRLPAEEAVMRAVAAAAPAREETAEAMEEMTAEGAPVAVEQPGVGVVTPPPAEVAAQPEVTPPAEEEVVAAPARAVAAAAPAPAPPVEEVFDVSKLPAEEQEMHRRANRVAKVSMQDIKMLKPDAVKQGRENRDICIRVRDDLDKARKEYDRRFRPILKHPVDYFYHWAVEILANGDAEALGEYPYPSPVIRR
jgi:hypothetical protein